MKTAYWMCGGLILGVLALPLRLSAEKLPEISSPIKQSSRDYPETIGGAPISGAVATAFPRVSHQVHGWKLPVLGPHRLVRITEVMRAPGPSTWRAWDPAITLQVSHDYYSCKTSWSEYPENGWLENSWEIEPSDPRGRYRFEVYFDGVLKAVIPFEVK
jgi:hypothetical protein